ncbi:MAG TPA: MmcQ/YjbR family DNA-binding protein [Ohtaekwangia sp.]|nr:MmcQ/YjbR family DNA-binding protein [Ohtaekwangia sp.]
MDLDALRTFCLSLPGTSEDIKWKKDLCFLVGEKMFCVASLEPPLTYSFKVTDEEFDELASREGFLPAPYMARAKWVLVNDPVRLKTKDAARYIRQSYALVAARLTKKRRNELGLE